MSDAWLPCSADAGGSSFCRQTAEKTAKTASPGLCADIDFVEGGTELFIQPRQCRLVGPDRRGRSYPGGLSVRRDIPTGPAFHLSSRPPPLPSVVPVFHCFLKPVFSVYHGRETLSTYSRQDRLQIPMSSFPPPFFGRLYTILLCRRNPLLKILIDKRRICRYTMQCKVFVNA